MKIYLLFFPCFFQLLSAQVVSLDPAFGSGGKVRNSFDVFSDSAGGLAIQGDGKILVCGINDFTVNGNVYLTRYESNGSLDAGFGNNGIAVTPLVTESDGVRIMKLLPDGKILVTSSRSVSNNVNLFDFATMRYNADGSVDTTFGVNGIVQTDINNAGNYANAVAVQSDGKIIVAGNTYINGNLNVATTLVRYLANGSLDTSFGTNGKVLMDLLASNSSQYVWDVKILSDDSILLGITTTALETNDFFRNIAIIKLDSSGIPDSSFGNNGAVITDFGAQDILYAIDEFQGSIFMAGFSRYPGYKMILSKYNAQGVLDQTFGNNGKVVANKDAVSTTDGLLGMKVLPTGKILCSGWSGDAAAKDALLIQFNPDGSIDTGFNQTGYITTDVDAIENSHASFAIQDDGKIVCSGWTSLDGYQDSTLVRYDVSALSVDGHHAARRFSVFPNPFTDQLSLEINLGTPEYIIADLLDAHGRTIKRLIDRKAFSAGENTIGLPMPEQLSKGVYFLRIATDDTFAALKIIK